MAYCETCEKEKKTDEQTRREGNAPRQSVETVGEPQRKSEEDNRITLAEQANHADPDAFGL